MKIKTKYNIGDYVIVEIYGGLTRGRVESINIETYSNKPYIEYNLAITRDYEVERKFIEEDNIICKSIKKEIRKLESKRNDNTRKTERVD